MRPRREIPDRRRRPDSLWQNVRSNGQGRLPATDVRSSMKLRCLCLPSFSRDGLVMRAEPSALAEAPATQLRQPETVAWDGPKRRPGPGPCGEFMAAAPLPLRSGAPVRPEDGPWFARSLTPRIAASHSLVRRFGRSNRTKRWRPAFCRNLLAGSGSTARSVRQWAPRCLDHLRDGLGALDPGLSVRGLADGDRGVRRR
jgi:hypothetical protein